MSQPSASYAVPEADHQSFICISERNSSSTEVLCCYTKVGDKEGKQKAFKEQIELLAPTKWDCLFYSILFYSILFYPGEI